MIAAMDEPRAAVARRTVLCRRPVWTFRRAGTVLGVLLGLAGSVSPAAAKSYTAERLESVVRLLPDGALDVVETIVFRFEDGTFRQVFREIPTRRTDGVTVTAAEMGGRRLPWGSEPGTAEVDYRSNRVRVVWHFSAVEGGTRSFTLRYQVRGAVRRTGAGDLLHWRATPGEHEYRVESAAIVFELPIPPAGTPEIQSRRTRAPSVTVEGARVRVESGEIRKNGWIEASLRFPTGAIAATPPAWQQRADAVAARAWTWIITAALVVVAGLLLLFALRQGYNPPPAGISERDRHQPSPPDGLAPPIAGALAANGRVTLEHAMAALFSLADRGLLEIREKPRGAFGQRDFVVTRRGQPAAPAAAEEAALQIAFRKKDRQEESVSLSQARSRLMSRSRSFSRALHTELEAMGLLDASRRRIRDRYNRLGIWLLVAAGPLAAPAALLTEANGGWPLLIPGAVAVLGAAAFIFGGTITPLSDEGARRAAGWRAYRRYLTAVAQDKDSAAGLAVDAVLPVAVALGTAHAWSKYLKRHGHTPPGWFHPATGDASAAFPALVASWGAGAGSGASGGSGGGAAGGGASGAG